MTEVTTGLYRGTRILGDVKAMAHAPAAITRRIERRWLWRRIVGRWLGRLTR
jgi:hypothetical protein